jgi:hypothetical protein
MTLDPYEYFPYRFGHALWSYVAERWGDEAVGAILKATLAGGIEPAFRRTIGLNLDQLSDQWRDAVQKRYLPEIGARARAKAVADALLTEKKSQGTLHLAPALSPDGSLVAYFTEKDFYSVDLWLADGNTASPCTGSSSRGSAATTRPIGSSTPRRTGRPTGSSSPSPPSAARGTRSVVVDAAKNRPVDRIKLKLSGVTTPSWSPDGQQLVFTGYEGGFSDLFVVNRDGGGSGAHRGQVRRPAPGLVSRRQDHRLRDRPRPGDRFPHAGHRQLPDRPVRPGDGEHPGARQDGQRQEREPPVGPGRAARSPSCPTATA